MKSITIEELAQLSNNDLALRMDSILLEREIENYGAKSVPRNKISRNMRSVVTILNTVHVQKQDETQKRKEANNRFPGFRRGMYLDEGRHC